MGKPTQARIWMILGIISLIPEGTMGCQQVTLPETTATPPLSNNEVATPSQRAEAFTITPVPLSGTELGAIVVPPAPGTILTPIALPDLSRSVNMTYDRTLSEVVAFGGNHCALGFECNQTWVWGTTTWRQLEPQSAPQGRIRAGFAYDEALKNAILFGSPTQVPQILDDTWVWDGQNWKEMHPLVSPPARWGIPGNILVYDAARKVVVMFGGEAYVDSMHSKDLNDTWLWEGTTWKQAFSGQNPPPPQGSGVYMAYDYANQVVVLLDLNTTWTWNGKTWAQQHPPHQPFAVPDGTIGYDEGRHETVLLGEQAETSQSVFATWIWDGKDWTEIQTSASQIDTTQFGGELHMVYDTRNKKLLLFSMGFTFVAWEWTGDGWLQLYRS